MELSAFTNLFSDLQAYVAGILNNDEVLQEMGAHFLAENQLDIEFEAKSALSKQGLACLVMTPQAKYQGHNTIQQTFTCEELTLQIVENPPVNRARLKKEDKDFGTALDVAKAASDRLAGPQGGYFGKFTTKEIRESEQGGLLVCTVTFGCTVYEKLDAVISGDLSGHWVEVPFVRISDLSSWLEDWLSGNVSVDVDLTDYREKTDLSTYTKTVLSWNTNPETVYGSKLTWRPESEWWCNNADVSAQWDAGTVIVKWDGEKWIGLGNAVYVWVDMGNTDPHATELTLDLRPVGGQQVFELTRSGYNDIYTPDGDRLALSSEVAALYTNEEIDTMMGKKRGLSDLSVYSETEPYTPTGDTLATKSLVAETSASLSAKLMLKDWQNYALSSEWYSGKTMIRTYDGVQHWVDLSSPNIINISTFQRQGFNFTDDPVSGIMDIAFGRGLFPHNVINLATSKVKHVWYPSQLTSIGQNCFNNCTELETVLMADYDPGEMAKTLRIGHRAFRGCPKLSRIELPALSVTLGGSQMFVDTPLSAQSEWPDLEPGLWMYGWMKGETDAKQNLSGLLNLPPETIHVGYPRKEDSGEYLPLSGGTMTGELAFDVPGKAASIFDGETLRLDPGALGETSVAFPIVGGSHDVAYKDLTWQKTDTELSVGVGRYKAYVEPGELLARDDGLGGSDPQKKTQYMWDGMIYTVIDNSGPTSVTHNYNLMYPTAGGTLATREWTNQNMVKNVDGVAGIMSAEVSAWADISATAIADRLYVLVDA